MHAQYLGKGFSIVLNPALSVTHYNMLKEEDTLYPDYLLLQNISPGIVWLQLYFDLLN